MANTAYDQLLSTMAAVEAKKNTAEKNLTDGQKSLKNDGLYNYNKKRILSIDTTADKDGGVALKVGSGGSAHYYDRYQVWIDSKDVMWYDGTTPDFNKTARGYVYEQEQKVQALKDKLTDATNAYNTAKTNIEKYEQSSPVAKSIASTTNIKNILLGLAGLIGIGLIVFVVIKRYNKKP